ncbi:MAG: EAL domain-containing protein [Sulfuricaulis sp.]|nr:EAL domain-containing protein [Sulfuricaulis sp.]
MPTSTSDRFYLDLLRAYVDSADDAIFVLCDELKFLFCNRVMERWVGEPESALTQHNQRVSITRFFKDSADAGRFLSHFTKTLHEAATNRFECRLEPPRGLPRWVEFSLNKVGLEAGQMVIGVARDITKHKEAETSLLKLSSAIEQTADSVVITDTKGVIEYVNPAFENTTGFSQEEALGKTPALVKSGRHDRAFYDALWSTILRGEVFRAIFVNRRKDGALYHEEKTITPLRDGNGRITHFVSTGKDITERMKDQERLDYLAYYDALTGLPNRNLLHDRLGHALDHARRQEKRTAILLLNIDNFNSINNSLGHDVGDRLLKAVAARLRASVREENTVARMGGDEFAVLLEDAGHADNAARTAHQLVGDLAKPFLAGEHEIFISVSVGIAIAPADGNDADSLWKNADTAMHRVKEHGHNAYRFYSADMTTKIRERLTLRTQLSRALEREEFRLYYQPILDLRSERIVGVEALIRWQHPDRGIIAPDEFMSVLEESGLIVRAGEWVLRAVCEQLQQWSGLLREPVRVAVNISGRQFADPGFLDKVGCMHCLLKGRGRCAGVMEFEITESVLMNTDLATIKILKALRENGIRLTIDDFGTGYSSLAYLTRFRVDAVKIDRSFVQDMIANRDAAALVEVIITMAHVLNLTVIAEGVETSEQVMLLRNLGCDMMQGYVFSPPLPADEMTGFLEEGRDRLNRVSSSD